MKDCEHQLQPNTPEIFRDPARGVRGALRAAMDAKRKALERSERRDLFRKVEKLFPPDFVRRTTRNGAGRRAAGEGGRSEIDVLTDLVSFVAGLKQRWAERPVRREAATGSTGGGGFRGALFSSARLLCLEVATDTGIILKTGRGADRVLGPLPWLRCTGHSIKHLVHLADFETLDGLLCERCPPAASRVGAASPERRATVRLACFTYAPGLHARRQVRVFRYISFDAQVLPVSPGRAVIIASIPKEFDSYNAAAASHSTHHGSALAPFGAAPAPKLEHADAVCLQHSGAAASSVVGTSSTVRLPRMQLPSERDPLNVMLDVESMQRHNMLRGAVNLPAGIPTLLTALSSSGPPPPGVRLLSEVQFSAVYEFDSAGGFPSVTAVRQAWSDLLCCYDTSEQQQTVPGLDEQEFKFLQTCAGVLNQGYNSLFDFCLRLVQVPALFPEP